MNQHRSHFSAVPLADQRNDVSILGRTGCRRLQWQWRSGVGRSRCVEILSNASVHVYEGPSTADSERWTKWGDDQRH